jgi:hypothetical protein
VLVKAPAGGGASAKGSYDDPRPGLARPARAAPLRRRRLHCAEKVRELGLRCSRWDEGVVAGERWVSTPGSAGPPCSSRSTLACSMRWRANEHTCRQASSPLSSAVASSSRGDAQLDAAADHARVERMVTRVDADRTDRAAQA